MFELLFKTKQKKTDKKNLPLSDTTPLIPLQLHVFISFLLHPARHVRGMFPSLLSAAGRVVSKGPQNKSGAHPSAPMACLSFQTGD